MTTTFGTMLDRHPLLTALAMMILFIATLMAFFEPLIYWGQYAACHAKADSMNVGWSYGMWQECMVVVDGKTIPLDSYKVMRVVQ